MLPTLRRVISQAAVDAVTNPANLAAFGTSGAGMRAVRMSAVIDELRQVEGLSADDARRCAREAVAHIGGHVEARKSRGGFAAGRARVHHYEVWWVPLSAIREPEP
jgi:hypothetical protein